MFSNKFVMNVLRDSRKCPKCHNNFCTRYEKLSVNHRPLLLPCGHNLCENCAFQNSHNLVCAVCHKLAPLPAGSRAKNVKVRSYIDLNYFLFGELWHYNGLREFCNNSMMNCPQSLASESVQSLDDESEGANCRECDKTSALGICRECHVLYCGSCFRKVHQPSKVLKSHILDKFEGIKYMKDLQPHPYHCFKHKSICDRFCLDCKLCVCYLCAKHLHNSHNCVRLRVENENHIDDVINATEMVKISRETLRKAQKEISATQAQMENYAKETYIKISDYFLELHNFLQNQQRMILCRFYETYNQTESKLTDAAMKIDKSLNAINVMRLHLERFSEQMPNDINVHHVLTVYNNKIDTLMYEVNITKIMQNPFVFKIGRDYKADITKLYNYTFMDPKLEINFDAQFYANENLIHDQTMFSMLEATSSERSFAHSMSHINNQRKQKPKNKKSAQHSISYQQRQSQLNNSLRNSAHNSLLASSMVNIQNRTQSTRKIMARVTHFESPVDFYIQQEEHLDQLRDLVDKYIHFEAYSSNIPENITLERVYMIYYANDKQWYRGLIKKMLNKNLFETFLVDIGKTLEVEKKSFRDLNTYGASLPYAAVRCALYDLMPVGETWSQQAITFFMDITKNERICLSIIESNVDEYWKVDVLTTENSATISVRDSFLYAGLAQSLHPPPKRPALLKNRIPKHILQATEVLNVKIRHVDCPHEFYVTKVDHINLKINMIEELNQIYEAEESLLNPLLFGFLHMGCAVVINARWHRARIEDLCEKGMLKVRLVDEGVLETVSWQQVFPLKAQFFKQREYTIKCSLADIEPLQDNDYEWTNEAIAEFKVLTSNPTLQMTICSVSQDESTVALYVCKKNWNVNIGAMLVKNGHGVSTGKNTLSADIANINSDQYGIVKKLSNNSMHSSLNAMSSSLEKYNTKTDESIRPLKRTQISIIHVNDPGEFYLQPNNLKAHITKFLKQLQMANTELKDDMRVEYEWFVGDHCLVLMSLNAADVDEKYYRGVINSIEVDTDPSAPYVIFLRDYGYTVKNICDMQLFKISREWDRVTNAVFRCHLACLSPTAGQTNWSSSAIDYFKHTIASFPELSATLHKKHNEDSSSTPIMLWGTITENTDPLAPCIARHSSINRIMVQAGLAHLTEPFDVRQQIDRLIAAEVAEGEVTIEQWFQKFHEKAGLTAINKAVENSAMNDDDIEICEQLQIPDEYLLKYNNNQELSIAWHQYKKIEKTVFVANPTYVDKDCIIYLHDNDDDKLLQQICDHIKHVYETKLNELDVDCKSYTFDNNQPCIAKYYLDKKYYRAIIQSYDANNQHYDVRFIDFGNIESVHAQYIHAYTPFPEVPALASRYRLEDICPKNGASTYATNVLDIIHSSVVEKMVNVRVSENSFNDDIKSCSIRVGAIDLAQVLCEKGLVDRTWATRNFRAAKSSSAAADTYCQPAQPEALDDEDYLTQLLERCEAAQTPPLTPSQRMFNNSDYQHLRKQLQLEPVVNDLSYVEEDDVLDDIDADRDLIRLGHSFAEIFWKNEDEAQEEPIDLDSLNTHQFVPNDTSTITQFSGIDAFKRAHLPLGVSGFPCEVVRIISPTILQILPLLKEFQYRETEIQQLINYMVESAKPLQYFEPRTICLARYSKDGLYYRAVIRSFNAQKQTAEVLYVDYLNRESVSIKYLRRIPIELANKPLRTMRVRLYGMTPCEGQNDTSICNSLVNCLSKRIMFARVNRRPCEADCAAGDLIQVSLFETEKCKQLVYQNLIDQDVFELQGNF